VARRPSALLRAGLALAAAWLAWSLVAPELDAWSQWPTALAAALVSLPLLCGALLLALPTAERHLGPALAVAAVAVLVAVAGSLADVDAVASIGKAVAGVVAGLAVGRLLEAPWHAALVAVLVAVVDVYSVFAGPTKSVVEGSPGVLDAVGVALAAPGYSQAAILGTTDFVFLGLLAGAALRYDLRPRVTLPLLAASFSVTLLVATALDRALPALPLLSLAFLLPNLTRLGVRTRSEPPPA
jgi:hypothetical protein